MIVPEIDLGGPAEDVIDWLLSNLRGLFDGIGVVLEALIAAPTSALLALHPLLVIALFTAVPLVLRRWGVAIFALLGSLLILGMGLWQQTMQSLGIVLVATLIAAVIGIPLGILVARRAAAAAIVRPVLDVMQATPAFVYLIPAVFFFGVGVVPGLVATVVFALAPAVRLTDLGIRQVDAEAVEAAHAFGATPGQLLRDVQLPLALPTIMAGINQVIMLSLSMVVVAGLAGAPGLGVVVTQAVSKLDVGQGIEGGLAVVILAIYLDRVSGALATPRRRRARAEVAETVSTAEATRVIEGAPA